MKGCELISWLNPLKAAKLLLPFPPLFTVGQLLRFKSCHGLAGVADPAADYFPPPLPVD